MFGTVIKYFVEPKWKGKFIGTFPYSLKIDYFYFYCLTKTASFPLITNSEINPDEERHK